MAFALKANTVPDNAITGAKIADGTITGADIATGTITASDFATGLLDFWKLTGNAGTFSKTTTRTWSGGGTASAGAARSAPGVSPVAHPVRQRSAAHPVTRRVRGDTGRVSSTATRPFEEPRGRRVRRVHR